MTAWNYLPEKPGAPRRPDVNPSEPLEVLFQDNMRAIGHVDSFDWTFDTHGTKNIVAWRTEYPARKTITEHVVGVVDGRIETEPLANSRQVAGTHYKDMGVEPWEVIDTWPLEQRIGAYRAGALKYLMRMGSKDERLQEIEKCGHYVEKLIETLKEVK